MINNERVIALEALTLVQDILVLKSSFQMIEFTHRPRENNKMVDALAKWNRENEAMLWSHPFPLRL